MSKRRGFIPSELTVLGVSSHKALGRAMEIMLKAVGLPSLRSYHE
jgi:hypothetical protein